jgi:hypothetical protein
MVVGGLINEQSSSLEHLPIYGVNGSNLKITRRFTLWRPFLNYATNKGCHATKNGDYPSL